MKTSATKPVSNVLIDLPSNDLWQKLSAKYREALPFQDERVQVQVYAGFQHALFEAAQGLTALFSHKKTIAIVGANSEPAVEMLAVEFSERLYNVVRVSAEEIASSSDWLSKIQTDLIFVLAVEDDPVSGRLLNLAPLTATLKDKKIFLFQVSHAAHRLRAMARPLAYEIQLLSLAPDRALLVAGERFKIKPVLAPRLPWVLQSQLDQSLEQPPSAAQQDARKAAVLAFEASLPKGYQAFFKVGDLRLFDRAVIFHPDCDGSAICDLLAENGFSAVETTSPCRWNQPRLVDWLLARGETEAVIRGMIVIDARLLSAEFSKKLVFVTEQILKMQKER